MNVLYNRVAKEVIKLWGEHYGGRLSTFKYSKGEPLTYHRRGHWVKPSIAHHAEVAEWQTRYVQGVVSLRA